MDNCISVKMLGELSLTCGEVKVTERANRSKEWILIAFLLCNRNRAISRDELLRLLVETEDVLDHGNTFRKILWRARKAVEPLSAALETELIQYKGGMCSWNAEVPVSVDAEVFEDLCKQAEKADNDQERLEDYRAAASLFKGEFLPKLSGEQWIAPLSAFYLNLFVDACMEALPLMIDAGLHDEAEQLSQEAIRVSPYYEEFYQFRMQAQIGQKDYDAAAQTYQNLHQRFLSELDVTPSEESQALYQEVLRRSGQRRKPLGQLQEQLRESERPDGAWICDFSMFRMFYQMEARSALRRGDAIHVGVLSLEGRNGKELSDRVLENAMRQLGACIRKTLRVGDVASACSASQYILLLVQANYENSQMVCQRVRRAFSSAHPSSNVTISVDVMPLEPLSF